MTNIEKTLIAANTFTNIERAIARAKRQAVEQLWTISDVLVDGEEIRIYLQGESQPLVVSAADFMDFYNYGKPGDYFHHIKDFDGVDACFAQSYNDVEEALCKFLRFTEGMKYVRFASDAHINDPEPEEFDEDNFEEAMQYYQQ